MWMEEYVGRCYRFRIKISSSKDLNNLIVERMVCGSYFKTNHYQICVLDEDKHKQYIPSHSMRAHCLTCISLIGTEKHQTSRTPI